MKLKGTQTEKNLMQAFAGESQARNKYDYFASIAKKEGYVQIANYFSVSIDYLLGHEATDDGWAEDPKLEYLQRGLKQMDSKDLAKAEILLKAMFEDIFNDDEEHNGI